MSDAASRLSERKAQTRPDWHEQSPDGFFAALESQPIVGDALCALGDGIRTAIDVRTRELVALRVGAVRGCHYVWRGHCHIALHLGLTRHDIARVAVGPQALDGRDRAVLRAVDDALADQRVDAQTRGLLGDDALAVTITTGFYDIVTRIMGDAEPEPDAMPIAGLETPDRARQSRSSRAA